MRVRARARARARVRVRVKARARVGVRLEASGCREHMLPVLAHISPYLAISLHISL